MSARVQITRFDATPTCPAFMSIRVNDGMASVAGTLTVGEPISKGYFTAHMTNQTFGRNHNVCGKMDSHNAETFLNAVLGPLDFARPAMQVAA